MKSSARASSLRIPIPILSEYRCVSTSSETHFGAVPLKNGSEYRCVSTSSETTAK